MAAIQRTSSYRTQRRRMLNEINVVPYIDVMLVLLVVFMVSAPMMTTGVVDLPRIGKSNQVPLAPIEVTIHADRRFSVRVQDNPIEKHIDQAALMEFIQAKQVENPQQPVVISADKNLKYEVVMNLMDRLQQQNIQRVGLMVRTTGQ